MSTQDILNPNLGWIVGPLAMATTWVEANLVNVDLSWAELLYSLAAVLYACAALIRTLKDKSSSDRCRKSKSTTPSNPDVEDTVDLK